MLDGAAGVEDQGKAGSGLLGEGLPLGGNQTRLAVVGLEHTVRIKAADGHPGRTIPGTRPLHAAVTLERVV